MKPLIVGELNPYGGDPYYALYPSPFGCTGQRLCDMILKMDQDEYLETFDRVNLCDFKWSIVAARERVKELRSDQPRKFILLGRKVCDAWGLEFSPFNSFGGTLLVLPHPSGLNRLWSEPGSFARARAAVGDFIPGLFAAKQPAVGESTTSEGGETTKGEDQ